MFIALTLDNILRIDLITHQFKFLLERLFCNFILEPRKRLKYKQKQKRRKIDIFSKYLFKKSLSLFKRNIKKINIFTSQQNKKKFHNIITKTNYIDCIRLHQLD